MNSLQAVILGIVQGLTEFLPISSSGHLAITAIILGVEESGNLMFFALLHLATLLSIFTVLTKDLLGLFKPPFKSLGLIIIATVPAVVVGFLFKDAVERVFSDLKIISIFFLITAILLFVTEMLANSRFVKQREGEIGLKTGLIMGLAQSGALFPGISRSGSTVCAGVLSGGNREKVVKFSFFMSFPVILGAAALEGYEAVSTGQAVFSLPIALGMAAAYISGILAVTLMLRLIKKVNFKWFSLYLVILAAGCIIGSFFY